MVTIFNNFVMGNLIFSRCDAAFELEILEIFCYFVNFIGFLNSKDHRLTTQI